MPYTFRLKSLERLLFILEFKYINSILVRLRRYR